MMGMLMMENRMDYCGCACGGMHRFLSKEGQTFISGMRPVILSQFFPQANLGNLPTEVDALIRGVIDRSK